MVEARDLVPVHGIGTNPYVFRAQLSLLSSSRCVLGHTELARDDLGFSVWHFKGADCYVKVF